MEWTPIGFIQSPFKQKFGTPRQTSLCPSAQASIKLNDSLPEGSLQGLQDFSHLWLLFCFHLNQNKKIKGKVYPPRLKGQSMGWMATRSPHRPNNIGLSLVRLQSVEQRELRISAVDLVDGTPVLDIKPYIKDYDQPLSDYRGGWLPGIEDKKRQVLWSTLAQEKIKKFSINQEFINMVEECLAQDPRPQTADNHQETFASHMGEWDFLFVVKEDQIEVQDIL